MKYNKQEKQEYIMEVQRKYDEYLYLTEKRNISYGELLYIQELKTRNLREFGKELDNELEKLGYFD